MPNPTPPTPAPDALAAAMERLTCPGIFDSGCPRCASLATIRAACEENVKALRLAQLDREGDWATLADSLNSALREAQLSEVKPEVEAIKAGANSLLYALNRERQALDAAREREQEWEHRAEKAEAVMAYVAEQARERERRLEALPELVRHQEVYAHHDDGEYDKGWLDACRHIADLIRAALDGRAGA